jgi:hypothetical protein
MVTAEQPTAVILAELVDQAMHALAARRGVDTPIAVGAAD